MWKFLSGEPLSPLVQRARPRSGRSRKGTDQHWSMLLLQSLSAGALAVLAGMAVVMALVGVYVLVIWPLTYWDLSQAGLEKYTAWSGTALWSVFIGGSLAGFWFFSGAAFKGKPRASRTAAASSVKSINTKL
jgi:hypothetical protein